MKKNKLLPALSVLALLSMYESVCARFPQVTIRNGLIRATLFLPDAEKGYYRGTRFDWAGLISKLEYEGHDYFGEWFLERAPYDPYTHDAVTGPAEAFGAIGYKSAAVGEEFLVIGVGGLRKPQERNHNSFNLYEMTNPGRWSVTKSRDRVSFTHEVDGAAGYSYVYIKTIRLAEGEPVITIEHSLNNIGEKRIETSVYGHNFFDIDAQRTGPGVAVEFPFAITIEGSWRNDNDLAVIDGGTISYQRDFTPQDEVYIGNLRGYGRRSGDFEFRIENRITGAGVRMTCDRPILRMSFWACSSVSCPEPFIDINVAPGDKFTWANTYELYEIR